MDTATSATSSDIDASDRAVTSPVTRTADAHDSAASRCCCCGRLLPTQKTGRQRLTCSPLCKARRDSTLRAIERRRAWIALWRTNESQYSQAEVDAEIAKLNADIADLLASLEEAPARREGHGV